MAFRNSRFPFQLCFKILSASKYRLGQSTTRHIHISLYPLLTHPHSLRPEKEKEKKNSGIVRIVWRGGFSGAVVGQ